MNDKQLDFNKITRVKRTSISKLRLRRTTHNSRIDPVFQLSTYNYPLDKERIAQFPLKQRDRSRLAVLHRNERSLQRGSGVAGRLEHRLFFDLPQYLKPGDVLVLNDTRVLPARLMARKQTTGGHVEILLVRISRWGSDASLWEVMIKGSVTVGQCLGVGPGLEIRVKERLQSGCWLVELQSEVPLLELLDRIGQPPLPPYIRRKATASDRDRYQTIYAKSFFNPSTQARRGGQAPALRQGLSRASSRGSGHALAGGLCSGFRPTGGAKGATGLPVGFHLRQSAGSIAAPTAGLHFNEVLMDKIRTQGVRLSFITLHIGPGTFRPVRSMDVRQHTMEPEHYEISAETAQCINEVRSGQGRIIAVGTSTTRALEAAAGEGTGLNRSGVTDLFILPGYKFKVVQALITNFHMPQSTLLMLVSAFAGLHTLKEVYAEAIRMDYRFLSFGDAMLIL